MKINILSISMAKEQGMSLVQKMILALVVLALLFASLPAAGAFAAPASANNSAREDEMQASWRNKLRNLRAESLFYLRVRVYPADFDDLDELAKAHDILNEYGVALRRAQTIAANRAGFDARGRVISDNQANQSLKDLGEQLRIMRALRKKLHTLDGKYRLLPLSAVTVAPAQ